VVYRAIAVFAFSCGSGYRCTRVTWVRLETVQRCTATHIIIIFNEQARSRSSVAGMFVTYLYYRLDDSTDAFCELWQNPLFYLTFPSVRREDNVRLVFRDTYDRKSVSAEDATRGGHNVLTRPAPVSLVARFRTRASSPKSTAATGCSSVKNKKLGRNKQKRIVPSILLRRC